MPLPSVDLGLFVAYVLPGVLALYGLSLAMPELKNIFQKTDERQAIGVAITITLVSMLVGIGVSIGRGLLLDLSFHHALPVGGERLHPWLGAVASVAPDYGELTDSNKREAFKLAVANEQRAYQFSGNAAIALLIVIGCRVYSLPSEERRRPRVIAIILLTIVGFLTLYGGARISHYRYMQAVAEINAAPSR